MTVTPVEPAPAASFEDLYTTSRGVLYGGLATITNDRDLATEAVDVGFTRWRRRLRKPPGINPAAGVMAGAFSYASKQVGKGANLSGFRLDAQAQPGAARYLERFRQLSVDERALLVMRDALGWGDADIAHAVGAEGAGRIANSITDRLAGEGYDRDEMADSLRQAVASHVEPLSRLETVKAKGGMQKLAGFAAGAALLVAGVAGGVALIDSLGSSTEVPAAAGTQTTAGTNVGEFLTAENAIWQRVPVPGNAQNIMTLAHDGENFVMLGQDDRGRTVMMESDNGLDWAQIPAPQTGQNMWFSQMVVADDKLVLVGNGFDDVRGRESIVVFTSTADGGWEQADLPVEDSVEFDGMQLNMYTWVSTVSVNDSGITIVGNQGAEFDAERILRDVVDPELFRNGWGFNANGLDFYDNNGNLTESMTWEELGIDPAIGALLGGNRPVLWNSADGVNWEMTTGEVPAGTQGVGAYVVAGDVEAMLAWGNRGQSVWVKSDGEWKRPDIDGSLTGMTTWNDQLVVSGHDGTTGQPSIWTSSDGTQWSRTDVPAGIQQFFPSASTIIGIGFDNNFSVIGPAQFEVDDFTITNTTDGKYSVLDADGNLVVEVWQEDVAVSNDGTTTITNPETGEAVVQFESILLENAWTALYREFEGQNPGPPQMTILVSNDGSNWGALQPEEANFYPQAIAFGNNAALMAGWAEGGDFIGFGGGGMRLLLVTAG